MKLNRLWLLPALAASLFISCEKDDDGGQEVEPPRDRAEQDAVDQETLKAFLSTHFYNYEEFENPPANFDYTVRIDTIHKNNADKTPLLDSPLLETKNFEYDGVDYKVYVLKVREGAAEQPKAKFSDSTFVAYQGMLLNGAVFDASRNPLWFDLTKVIPGFAQGLTEFRGASGFELLPDNTVKWENDFGIGAMFIPSGLAYFNGSQASIPAYSPLVFIFKVYGVKEADHDGDGIPSWKEDLNGDQILLNDDTDGDRIPNYMDPDDDGDFIPTREEISDEDGNIIVPYPDSTGDGTPDYLDPKN